MGALTSKRKESSLEGEEISFDHFQVLRAIGKGSFGKVCIVQKRDSKQMFAMKYMNKTQCEARDALNNVFREIEILASLNHPFLVNLWFSFQDSEDMFMVVDLLLGGDLRYHVQQGVQFSDQDVRLYILEVASALAYLHARNIIHRDIKPDNLLLDEEGHVHLTDFNIATVLRSGQLATSMSGTKPYMAPEVFECAAETCEGYSYAVDWWSLGVTAYEVRRGKRPFDIHSNTSLHEIRHMFLQGLKFSPDCHPSLVHVLSRLLVVSPDKRISRLEDLVKIPYVATLDMDTLLQKKCRPAFTPPKDHLNCDPTFELEEMIIESRPLHKKKKRLSKQKSIKETQSSLSGTTEGEALVYEGMLVFNREQEEARKARERREQEWQAELEESMKMSDPTGHGCNFTGSQSGTPVKVRSKGEAGGSGQAEGSSPLAVTSSPTDHTPLTKVTVSPSNVRARIAGSPKVKVRGTTVTIESPRSSSSLTKSSTQQLKERLRELKADRRRQGESASESEYSDVTQSDDLTLTGRRSPSHSPGKPKRRSVSKSPERSQRRSTSRSPKLSPRKSTSGSPRTPGRSSRKSAGRASRELREASAMPHEGREEATASSLANEEEEQPPVAYIAQENFREDGDKGLSRPASLPAEVRHEIREFSKMRISEPPPSLSDTQDDACESSASTHDQTTEETTSEMTENSSRDEDDCHKSAEEVPQSTALSNGCLASTRISRASLEIQDFRLEDKVGGGRAPVLDQGRRHSMEPRRRTTETNKRFSEGHRSSSVTGKANPDTWRRSFESRKGVTEPCNNSSDVLRNSSRILKDPVEGGESSCKRSENSAEAQTKSCESLRRSSNDSSKYSSSGVRTISCDGTEDSSHTHHLTEIQPSESQKSPSGSRGSKNDTSDEGIEITF